MKILITGGAGFIGSHLTDVILAAGGHVRVLDNLSTGNLENLPKGKSSFEFIRGDIQERKTVLDSIRDMDAVVLDEGQPPGIRRDTHGHHFFTPHQDTFILAG